MQNGTKHKYVAPLSSQAEVKKCYNIIKKRSEADQLAFLRREVKLKKALFSEMPNDFGYFKQYNITAKLMYESLLALHSVDLSDQEVITVEDVYVASESEDIQSASKQAKRSRVPVEEPQQQDSICVQALTTLKTRANDHQGKTLWIYPNDEIWITLKGNASLKSGIQ